MAILNGEPARTRIPHFNAGDKVRCKWAKNSNGTLVVGNVYTIQTSLTGHGGSSVSVEGIEGAFDCSRFELVKPGSKIKPNKVKAGRVTVTVTESIKWINAAIQMPDDDRTVLVYSEHESEPVWFGYVSEGVWHFADGFKRSPLGFTFWADMPVGPKGGDA